VAISTIAKTVCYQPEHADADGDPHRYGIARIVERSAVLISPHGQSDQFVFWALETRLAGRGFE
jgi:hypothetical protein